MATITLNNGFKMLIIGLGVWRIEGQEIKDLILNSIKIGYRHFDCAAKYKNEQEVGKALKEAFDTGLVKREDLFITTKLKKLQLDYLDLYLVHFPVATRHTGVGTTDSALGKDGVLDIDTTISLETTWHAMEGLVSSGLVRSIGIRSNIVLQAMFPMPSWNFSRFVSDACDTISDTLRGDARGLWVK
ncbi:NAD(P)-linked oxidoreductase superfamily protein [Trifolium repens]|nr:NAD(P)-linked oxidoreductase superfamily protein [Trifolium repens]